MTIEQYATADDGTPLHWRVAPIGSGTHPVAILIPGGQFKHLFSIPSAISSSIAAAGYLVLTQTEYRIAPPDKLAGQVTNGRWPDQTNDVELAVAAARADSRCNGEVFTVGGSAGASHAMYLAAKGLVKAAVCFSPCTQYDDAKSLLNIPFRDAVQNYAPDHLAEASPLGMMTATSSPIFLVSFTQDNIPAPQFTLAAAKTGVDSLLLPGAGHSWECWLANGVPAKSIAFLNSHRSN